LSLTADVVVALFADVVADVVVAGCIEMLSVASFVNGPAPNP